MLLSGQSQLVAQKPNRLIHCFVLFTVFAEPKWLRPSHQAAGEWRVSQQIYADHNSSQRW